MSGVIVPAGRLEGLLSWNVATRWFTRRAAAREVERKLETHAPASAFDYLLREPRDARRWRQIWITSGIVAFVALAPLAWIIVG